MNGEILSFKTCKKLKDYENIKKQLKDFEFKYKKCREDEVEKQWKIKKLKKKIDKATRHIQILLEIALEQDSDNVNLIDRLRSILKILQGSEDNE